MSMANNSVGPESLLEINVLNILHHLCEFFVSSDHIVFVFAIGQTVTLAWYDACGPHGGCGGNGNRYVSYDIVVPQ